jgi:hypothetical protein
VFIERSRDALRALRKNPPSSRSGARASSSAISAGLTRVRKRDSICRADPPYEGGRRGARVRRRCSCLNPDAVVIAERCAARPSRKRATECGSKHYGGRHSIDERAADTAEAGRAEP